MVQSLQYWGRKQGAAYARKWRAEHKERLKARSAAAYLRHAEKLKQYAREYRRRNHAIIRENEKRAYIKLKTENPKEFRARGWRNCLYQKYRLRPADLERMISEQDGKCALCFKTPNPGRRLSIDHDHATGKIRGLLCGVCNSFLGRINDDVTFGERLKEYIARGK